ncbi:MAG TPA: alpha/beta fold hydrolase [Burkholderiaceae bacterium]|nr:alpha/beta fold hydrolase [Burkholderiaceae bacterium]
MPAHVAQEVRFCSSRDGTRIAYARTGRGVPIVRAAHWLTHVEHELESGVWRPWIAELSRVGQLLRYDERGCGLSDRDVADVGLDAHVADLEAVVDAAGLDRFVLLALSQGGAIAATYAARHPERVSHLVMLGAFVRGTLRRDVPEAAKEAARLSIGLVRVGWGQANPAFNQMFTTQFMPDAPAALQRTFNEMQRLCTSPEQASRLLGATLEFDATAELGRIRAPTLVFHSRDDGRVPFEEGRTIAAGIPGARLVPLESRNHALLDGEPAWTHFFEELRGFLVPASGSAPLEAFASLTAKERELLDHLARGLDNAQLAARMGLAEKTVRNTVVRILDKLQVETRAQAIVRAREAGFGQRAPR